MFYLLSSLQSPQSLLGCTCYGSGSILCGMLVLITAVVIVQNSVYLSVIIFVVHIPDVILVGVLFHLKLIHFNFFIPSN